MKQNMHVNATLALLAVAAPTLCLGQDYTQQPFSADITMTTHNGTKVTGKYYFLPPAFRMDTNAQGHAMSMIVNGSTRTTYMVMHDQRLYIESHGEDNPMMRQALKPPSFDAAHPCGQDMTCQKVGTESVNGRVCDKWVGKDMKGNSGTAWIDQKPHFPIKAVSNDGSGMELTNVKEDKPDASLFQPPAEYRKMDIPGMLGQRPPA